MNQPFSYKLRTSQKAKRLSLAVYADGRVVLTCPARVKKTQAEKFLAEKSGWVEKKLALLKSKAKEPGRIFSYQDYLRNKGRAYLLARERIGFYNNFYGFAYNRIFIKRQKTVWGSCSSGKNLNFNFKIVFLPEKHRDYIIVHELCHLKEMNHSKSFWALVEKTFPDHKNIRKELRKKNLFYGEST